MWYWRQLPVRNNYYGKVPESQIVLTLFSMAHLHQNQKEAINDVFVADKLNLYTMIGLFRPLALMTDLLIVTTTVLPSGFFFPHIVA
jgi:hypothetical protein